MADTSRMSREVHVRICGGLVVRFLQSTRRYGGGVNLIQAFMCNVGTCRFDGKGETQVEETTRVSVPMRDTGADQLVVVLKSL
jgi:hypothetical protein